MSQKLSLFPKLHKPGAIHVLRAKGPVVWMVLNVLCTIFRSRQALITSHSLQSPQRTTPPKPSAPAAKSLLLDT